MSDFVSTTWRMKLSYPKLARKPPKLKNDVKNWEYREFLGNFGIFWELTWDFYKIIVGNAAAVAKKYTEIWNTF